MGLPTNICLYQYRNSKPAAADTMMVPSQGEPKKGPMVIAITRAAPDLIGYALDLDDCFLPEIASTTTDATMNGAKRFSIQYPI